MGAAPSTVPRSPFTKKSMLLVTSRSPQRLTPKQWKAVPCSCKVVCRLHQALMDAILSMGIMEQEISCLLRNCSSDWTPTQVAYGNPNEWYTMQLNVSSSPFKITASAFDENGVLIGSYSTNYITGFSFNDIHYIGFYVWGFDPADYSFRNIEGPFDSQANLSINTQSSSTTAEATVNVFGTLLDLSGLPIQNQTVVLSYAVDARPGRFDTHRLSANWWAGQLHGPG